MRIAIIGNSGTGKTALAEHLAEHLGIPLVPEIARDLIKEWGIIDFRAMPAEQMIALQHTVLDRKLHLEGVHSAFVADRSTADSAVIWLTRLANIADPRLSLELIERCKRGMERYDHLFLLPSDSIPLELDGIRQSNPARRLLFDLAMVGILNRWQRAYHTIHSLSPEDRLFEVCRYLGAPLENDPV